MNIHSAATLLALLDIRGIGPKKANTLVRNILPTNANDLTSMIELNLPKNILQTEWKSLYGKSYNSIIDLIGNGIHVIDFFSNDYPDVLRKLIDAPLVLFVKGNIGAISTKIPITIIGSRRPTEYTKKGGSELSNLISQQCSCIISGLAIGCDTIAHKAALNVGIPTVAVLAHGLDTLYPKENSILAQEIINSGGCLVSEYLFGTSAKPNHFIARDRIQAGLSKGGVLLQSALNGGSMHTIKTLQKIHAPIGALVPPPETQYLSEWGGSHEILKSSHCFTFEPYLQKCENELINFLQTIQSTFGDCNFQKSLF